MIEVFLSVLIVLVLVGLSVWAIKSLIPMDPPFVTGINVLAVVFVAIYVGYAVLYVLGFLHSFPLLVHRP